MALHDLRHHLSRPESAPRSWLERYAAVLETSLVGSPWALRAACSLQPARSQSCQAGTGMDVNPAHSLMGL